MSAFASSSPLELMARELARLVASHLHEQLAAQPGSDTEAAQVWMSAETAAAYLDWPKQRLYKLTATREIPFYKHDGRLLFNRQELDAWLQPHHHPARAITSGTR